MGKAPLKILYVEDDSLMRRTVSLLFRDDPSVDFSVASNNKEAIRLIRSNSYDLIIFDWWLVGTDGSLETCEESLEVSKSVCDNTLKVIFTSDEPQNVNKGQRHNVPVMQKGFINDLKSQIKTLAETKASLKDTLDAINRALYREV